MRFPRECPHFAWKRKGRVLFLKPFEKNRSSKHNTVAPFFSNVQNKSQPREAIANLHTKNNNNNFETNTSFNTGEKLLFPKKDEKKTF